MNKYDIEWTPRIDFDGWHYAKRESDFYELTESAREVYRRFDTCGDLIFSGGLLEDYVSALYLIDNHSVWDFIADFGVGLGSRVPKEEFLSLLQSIHQICPWLPTSLYADGCELFFRDIPAVSQVTAVLKLIEDADCPGCDIYFQGGELEAEISADMIEFQRLRFWWD